jgi:hypothetical protein
MRFLGRVFMRPLASSPINYFSLKPYDYFLKLCDYYLNKYDYFPNKYDYSVPRSTTS